MNKEQLKQLVKTVTRLECATALYSVEYNEGPKEVVDALNLVMKREQEKFEKILVDGGAIYKPLFTDEELFGMTEDIFRIWHKNLS